MPIKIKKALILAGGMGTRFLPLSRVVSKELWPLVDKPIIHYIVEEIKKAGIKQIVIVLPSSESATISYFKKDAKLEKILKKRKNEKALIEIEELQRGFKDLSFSFTFQEKPLGDGEAILRAKTKLGKEPFVVSFCDDLIEAKTSPVSQLMNMFRTTQKTVVGVYGVDPEEVSSFGVVAVEKIARRFYKIKKIVEKPKPERAPSNLVLAGKYILTPEIFDFLEEQKKQAKENQEVVLANALEEFLSGGKLVYGYEMEGRWLKCGNKINWLKSHLYLSLKDPRYSESLSKFLKEIN